MIIEMNIGGVSMHFLCKCGYRLHDSSDNIRYKGRIIADQDWNEFWNLIEKLKKSQVTLDEIYDKIYDLFDLTIYQCPSCGRVYFQNTEIAPRLIGFTPCLEAEPEPDVNKKLLISAHKEKWKGSLYADWYDEKPEWLDSHGIILPNLNIQLDNLSFDDYTAFEKRFYELLEHLKGLNLITHAILNVNNKREFMWEDSKNQ